MIYLWLFIEFFKIGLFTFGGGYAMIPLIEEMVYEHNWLTQSEFYNFIGICESTPGPIAVNMATYIGSVQGGILGSIVATISVALPSFIIILLIATILKTFSKNKFFIGFIKGVKPVVVALILATGLILLSKSLGYVDRTKFDFNFSALIVFLSICAVYFFSKCVLKKKMSAVLIIILSAGLGIGVSILKI